MQGNPSSPMRVLIVEDHKPLRQALARAAANWGAQVTEAGSVREALDQLSSHPHLVLVDVVLPDGKARAIVERAVKLHPSPAIVAMSGQASPEEAFELARIGVRKYLAKPISLEDLTDAVQSALHARPDLGPLIASLVGVAPMLEVLDEVRTGMVEEALARVDQNRTGAATLLGVTRQAIQQAVRVRGHALAGEGRREHE